MISREDIGNTVALPLRFSCVFFLQSGPCQNERHNETPQYGTPKNVDEPS